MISPLQYHNPRYEYKGYFGCECLCDLKIGQLPSGHALILLTEIETNQGTSVTNRTEYLYAHVCKEFGLDPRKTQVVEHYPSSPAMRLRQTYAFVKYEWKEGKPVRPEWTYLKPKEAEILLTRYGLPFEED